MQIRLTGIAGTLWFIGFYFGTGAVFHWLLWSDRFEWNSAPTWALLLGWPIVMFILFVIGCLLFFICTIIVIILMDFFGL